MLDKMGFQLKLKSTGWASCWLVDMLLHF